MDLKQQLIEIEKELDDQVKALDIWELPFQSILSMLLLTIDNIATRGQKDTAMDYASRLSYIYPLIKANAAKSPLTPTTEAILKGDAGVYINDINFLNAYAHFCLLIPQIRKDLMEVKSIDGTNIQLGYPSKEVEFSETIDRLYSYLALQLVVEFPQHKIEAYTQWKVELDPDTVSAKDFAFIKHIFEHYNQYFILIKALPEDVFSEMTGLSYGEYHALSAAVRAFSDFFSALAKVFRQRAEKTTNPELANHLMSRYFEWAVCCLTHKSLGWFAGMTDLSIKKLDNFLSFYMQIYSDTTGESFKDRSFCGEGFFPPFTLLEDHAIYSPYACRHMLTINNILYSINKKQKKFFDEKISAHLEPTLICQLTYLFSSLPNISTKANINYNGGEIDFMVLSEQENIVLCFQVKSTIAPDSSRTVERVTDRVLEGMQQIAQFDQLPDADKQNIINGAFEKGLQNTQVINLLVTRVLCRFR